MAASIFQNPHAPPHIINALYDALKKNRVVVSLLGGGTYQYISAEGNLSTANVQISPEITLPYATNAQVALKELPDTLDQDLHIHLTKYGDVFKVVSDIGDRDYYAAVTSLSKEEALARSLMSLACLYQAFPLEEGNQ